MTVFKLPDLGEGLPDAEIVEWLVAEGDQVKLDQPLVSMETAKAVVEVPSPVSGRVVRFHGQAGDVIRTGAPLVEFDVEGQAEAQPEAESSPAPAGSDDDEALAGAVLADLEPEAPTEQPHGPDDLYDEFGATGSEPAEPDTEGQAQADGDGSEDATAETAATGTAGAEPATARDDSGTVVGNVQAGNEMLEEYTSDLGGVRVTPAVRALARKLRVDVRQVQPSGAGQVVTAADVRQAAAAGSAPLDSGPTRPRITEPAGPAAPSPGTPAPMATAGEDEGEWTPVRGPRRTMARVMSESHRSIVPTTLMDDADIQAWRPGEDITARLIRSLWAGASAEPGLNAWYDGDNGVRMVHKNMHVGMAVDTEDGLFVAALRNVNRLERGQLRSEINRLRDNVAQRAIPPEDLRDYTIILSNFGKFAGRYATPVITPPCVAIVAAGALRHEVVPVLGGMEVHRMIPLSLTFDHRACTGGEAARFLRAMLDDLARPE